MLIAGSVAAYVWIFSSGETGSAFTDGLRGLWSRQLFKSLCFGLSR